MLKELNIEGIVLVKYTIGSLGISSGESSNYCFCFLALSKGNLLKEICFEFIGEYP